MSKEDTIHLLRECDSGVKMAVISIDEVIDKVTSGDLKDKLKESKKQHEKLGKECYAKLITLESEEKEPNPVAKAMSYMKINMKLLTTPTDMEISELMFDGCNMGVKSLHKYLHQYQGASDEAKDLTEKVIKCEEELREVVKHYI